MYEKSKSIYLVSLRDLGNGLASCRVDNRQSLSTYGINKLTIDKKLKRQTEKVNKYRNIKKMDDKTTLVNLISGAMVRCVVYYGRQDPY